MIEGDPADPHFFSSLRTVEGDPCGSPLFYIRSEKYRIDDIFHSLSTSLK